MRNRLLSGMSAVVLLSLFAGSAAAQPQDAKQESCILKVNAAGTKLTGAVAKEISGCIKDKAGGKLASGQTVDACIKADRKAKVAKARSGVDAVREKSCPLPPDFGPTAAVAVKVGFGGDVVNLGELFGCSVDPAVSSATAACQVAVTGSVGKLLKLHSKSFLKCAKDGFKAVPPITSEAGLQACVGADPDGKLAAAAAKLGTKVEGKCASVPSVSSAFPGLCSGSTPAALFECAQSRARCGWCRAVNQANGLDLDCDEFDDGAPNESCRRPAGCDFSTMTLRTRSRESSAAGGDLSRLETGWTGKAHDGDFADGLLFSTDLDCPPEGDASNVCTVGSAHLPDGAGPGRCLQNQRIRCENIGGMDDACPSSSSCIVPFGLPLEMVTTNLLPLCLTAHLEGDTTGTLDRISGATGLALSARVRTFVGPTAAAPCPSCLGDEPGDGIASGTCVGGQAPGQACEGHGAYADGRLASFDCPPLLGANIGGSGRTVATILTTGTSALSAQIDCGASPDLCHCGVCTGSSEGCSSNSDCNDQRCSDVPSVSCASDPDCAAVDVGPCVGSSPPRCSKQLATVCASNADCLVAAGSCVVQTCDPASGSKQNACSDGICTDMGDGFGRCLADPGTPACFLSTIEATGSAELETPVVGGIACLGSTASDFANNEIGLPGPVRMTIDLERTLD